ncbi:MAG: isopenicillin N synthase family oxygenase [Sphingobacteriales bacterium]|nr:isopenicillin N synthase family oxygenase [Sphingobacteriales bacterium]MCC7222209.1 isopenicillin N synthase family oxygenase [Chitinophagales bacterium]
MRAIPQVDLAEFLSGDDARRRSFVQQLGKAYEEVGFVTVINHGITDEMINAMYTNVEAFFAQPFAVKKQYEVPGLAGQRGYTSFGKEHAKGSDAPDLKEFYQWGQTVTDNDPIKEQYPPNVELREVPAFNDTLYRAYRAFEVSGAHLLEAIALFLKLPENYFTDKIKNGNSILRCIHYPPITQEPKNAIRAEQHEDINLITLLIGASADGLEVLDKQNQWVAINAGPGEIVVNVGDMLQRLTNNRLCSTTHRVVNPPREKWHTPRYSIPFFLHPRSEMDLTCLESCVTTDNPLHYEPITAGEYLDERLREIGLKK